MKTIQAKVNPRLLSKASRLFTGTIEGRIIEILQNARRAGATQVEITNRENGTIEVRDNGRGIDDFSRLLDLGGSGWDDALEVSEDPAGVGLFCLAPRQLTVRSHGQIATISGDGWSGGLVTVDDDPKPVGGTLLSFQDQPWTSAEVDLNAVFSGLQVTVDGTPCPQVAFVSHEAVAHPELGCRIEVCKSQNLDTWHHSSRRGRYYGDNVLVNFHGQIVTLSFHEVGQQGIHFLVDFTGEPTGIRLMLPARTQLVENEAFAALNLALELEGFRYLQRRGRHRLPYKQYLRAQELGITLPEATPTYRVGLLSGDSPEPVQVTVPENFPIAQCFRFDPDSKDGHETDEANVHLLAALGTFEAPFVPVEIKHEYDGYSWANLPTIGKVDLTIGKALHESWVGSGTLICVDSLTIAAHASDGRVFCSAVCMAIPPAEAGEAGKDRWAWEERAIVTPEAQARLAPTEIWHHLGGFNDDGDMYDTQQYDFEKALDRFWDQLIGPDEHLRRRMFEVISDMENWQRITLTPDGCMAIQLPDGSERTVQPPPAQSSPQAE